MRYTLYAGSYFGIPVRIHFTFPLILIAFGAEAWFSGGWQAALWALLLILSVFVCVVLHEFGHSLQVKRYGIAVRDVVLLPIGGMARADRIPEIPRQEIAVAIAGPLVNFALAAVIFTVLTVLNRPLSEEPDYLTSLFAINLVLGTFNLIPAYPMDGGRILRALLAMKLPYLRATRYATVVGQLIALAFVVLGFVFSHDLFMLPIIAVFVFVGAMSEENMIRVRYRLGDRRIGEFVEPPNEPAWVPSPEVGTRVPAVDADAPALEVYYALKARKQPAVRVIDSGRIVGIVGLDRLESFEPLPHAPH